MLRTIVPMLRNSEIFSFQVNLHESERENENA